jgi:hypothetical protein
MVLDALRSPGSLQKFELSRKRVLSMLPQQRGPNRPRLCGSHCTPAAGSVHVVLFASAAVTSLHAVLPLTLVNSAADIHAQFKMW